MIVSIHQPQYLPWVPYFLKVLEGDIFIHLDSVDFQKNGMQNRNEIKTSQGAQWLTVPVLQKLGQKITEVQIDNTSQWRKKHWLAIVQYYGKARFFGKYAPELESTLNREWTSLCDLNLHLTQLFLKWMKIEKHILKSSEMKSHGKNSDLVLNLCLEVKAKTYISGDGGKNYLDEKSFEEAGIKIIYRSPELPLPYPQLYPAAGFINHLSALDLILNCGEEWRNYFPGLKK